MRVCVSILLSFFGTEFFVICLPFLGDRRRVSHSRCACDAHAVRERKGKLVQWCCAKGPGDRISTTSNVGPLYPSKMSSKVCPVEESVQDCSQRWLH